MKKKFCLFIALVVFYSCEKKNDNIKKEKSNRFYNYSLNSPENILIILNGGNDTLITDKGVFPVKSEMHENKAYIYHLKYKGHTIGNYFEKFENISEHSICLDSSFTKKEGCFDLVNLSADSLKKTPLSLTKKQFLEKHRIIH